MNVEVLLYGYLAVCASMIAFNCVCIFVFRQRDRSMRRRGSRLEKDILHQLECIQVGKAVEEQHKTLLRRKLKYTGNLRVFDRTLEQLQEQKTKDIQIYMAEINPVFAQLALKNRYTNTMQLAYFAYVIKKYHIIQKEQSPEIMSMMMELLQEPGLYCRENAIQAIYSTGNCKWVLRGLHMIDEGEHFHHQKLLTDGLLSFPGEQAQLVQSLWDAFPTFSVSMQVVILDYIRFSGVNTMQSELLTLLVDDKQDDELRFSCIRYFGKYPCDAAYPVLLSFVDQTQKHRWEYAAIAATALSAYPGERTVELLKEALHSANWHVRFNAAQSLEVFQLSYWELSDVMEGGDRYAREILQYQMDMKNARQAREEAMAK